MGLGRPRCRHNSGNSDPERALVPSLPTAIRSSSGLRCLRRTGAGTSETGKAAKELAESRFPRGDTVPFPAKRPPPARGGSTRVLASLPPALLALGQCPQRSQRSRLFTWWARAASLLSPPWAARVSSSPRQLGVPGARGTDGIRSQQRDPG